MATCSFFEQFMLFCTGENGHMVPAEWPHTLVTFGRIEVLLFFLIVMPTAIIL